MAGKINEKFTTSQQPPETSRSQFINIVRSILECDHITSPFSSEQNIRTLEESQHILTRAYANQLGLSPIDYGLPKQQWRNPQLNVVQTKDLHEVDSTPVDRIKDFN